MLHLVLFYFLYFFSYIDDIWYMHLQIFNLLKAVLTKLLTKLKGDFQSDLIFL